MNRSCRIAAVAILIATLPAFATVITTFDTACDPTVTPPSSGGCVWYNLFFLDATTGAASNGSSFTNYYVPSGDPPWTFSSPGSLILRVLDGGHQGDTFDVFDNGNFLGTTSATPIDANHACTNDPTGGNDPAACFNDPLMSRGTFLLPSGSHSLNITWNQKVPGGPSAIQWFEINVGAAGVVPEPSSFLITGAGLAGLGLLMRRRFAR